MVKKIHHKDSEIETLKQRIEELENNYRRALADYQNQERRHQEQESNIVKMANGILIEKLLLSLDSLKLAQKHINDKGLQLVIDQLLNTLRDEGLKQIETDNQTFDPLTMDCTEIVPGEVDKVMETISEGYYLNDKVLRPAKVKVGTGN